MTSPAEPELDELLRKAFEAGALAALNHEHPHELEDAMPGIPAMTRAITADRMALMFWWEARHDDGGAIERIRRADWRKAKTFSRAAVD